MKFPAWEGVYQDAIRETNPLRVGEKLYAAEVAIKNRLSQLKESSETSAERQAIATALGTLEQIHIKTFGHPDWQT